MPSDKTIMMQTCRRCGEKRFSKMAIVDGKMVDVPVIVGTPLEINTNQSPKLVNNASPSENM